MSPSSDPGMILRIHQEILVTCTRCNNTNHARKPPTPRRPHWSAPRHVLSACSHADALRLLLREHELLQQLRQLSDLRHTSASESTVGVVRPQVRAAATGARSRSCSPATGTESKRNPPSGFSSLDITFCPSFLMYVGKYACYLSRSVRFCWTVRKSRCR